MYVLCNVYCGQIEGGDFGCSCKGVGRWNEDVMCVIEWLVLLLYWLALSI